MNRSIEEQLQKDGFLLKLTIGKSMEPMLHQWQEQPVIKALGRKPKRFDVVLFKRNNGQYVLHRIIGMKGDRYRIRGDNCYETELVSASQLLGILEGFYRGERYIDCEKDKAYRFYVYRHSLGFPFRYGYLRIRSFAARCCRSLLGRTQK